MHDPEDEGGDSERVAEASDGVGELVGELDEVLVEPASRDFSEAIEAGDGGLGEDTSKQVAGDTTDSVGSKDL